MPSSSMSNTHRLFLCFSSPLTRWLRWYSIKNLWGMLKIQFLPIFFFQRFSCYLKITTEFQSLWLFTFLKSRLKQWINRAINEILAITWWTLLRKQKFHRSQNWIYCCKRGLLEATFFSAVSYHSEVRSRKYESY